MSNQTVISVEDLGKRYNLNHQADRQRYSALRDVLANKVKGLFSQRGRIGGRSRANEDFWALKGISFEVKEGEVLGIIGRNGAGKSTLLKILSRITEPSEGHVRIKGRVASLLEVGTGFHPELTGRENIFLNGAVLGMSRNEIKGKFDEIVAFAQVEKFLDTAVKYYSSGMYVRLAFAVAAHLEPEILIIDEVLAVGDAQFQKKCITKMNSIAGASGKTVLIVTHQLSILNGLAKSGLLLEGGRLQMAGKSSEVITEYLAIPRTTERSEESRKRIHSISIWANDEPAEGLIPFASDLRIEIHLARPPHRPWAVNLEVAAEDGARLFLFSTQPHDDFRLPDTDELALTLEIPRFSPAPGSYHINVQITEPAVRILEHHDVLIRFTVVALPTATWPYSKNYGSYFPHHRWSTS